MTQKLTVTYDEADVDMPRLDEARRAAFKVVCQKYGFDLNQIPREGWQLFSFALTMHYLRSVAASGMQFQPNLQTKINFDGEEVPFD